MKAVVRILLMVNLAFLLALGLSLLVLLEQGRDDVAREQRAMVPVIEALLVSGLPRETIEQLGNSLRHVRVGNQPHPAAKDVPAVFVDLFRQNTERRELALTASGGQKLVLVVDDLDEITEVWDSTLQVLWVFLAAMLVSNLAIYSGVSHGIRPLSRVNAALRAIQSGNYQIRVGVSGVYEVDQLSGYLNDMAGALQQAEQENRNLTRTLMAVQEQERGALARELHDDLGQYVTAIRTQAWMMPLQQQHPERLQQLSEQVIAGCDAVQTGFRRIVNNLYPVLLEQLGLQAALEELANQFADTWALDVDLQIELPDELNEAAAAHLYRLVQEALTNVIRHARAQRARVILAVRDDVLLLEIADDGQGSVEQLQSANATGIGLRSMRERCQLLNGQLRLMPSPLVADGQTGIAIVAEIPLGFVTQEEGS